MFADSFLANLLLFVAGQAAAWSYLRTGRTAHGFGGTIGLWTLLDAWLLANYVFAVGSTGLTVLLSMLQGLCLFLVGSLGYARWRRRWSKPAKVRQQQFAEGMAALLRADLDAAAATFTRLVRVDPWDAAAWIALGDVQARRGDKVRASRCYRRALAVDVRQDFADLLRHHRLRAG